MTNYYVSKNHVGIVTIVSSQLCGGQHYNTDVLGSAGIGSIQKNLKSCSRA